MIVVYACLLLVIAYALLPGSDLRRLGQFQLRHTWLIMLALADQILVISVLPERDTWSQAAHLASYGLAALFAILNFRAAGTWIVGVGGLSNLVAITANKGVMPATPAALEASGWHPDPGRFANSAVLPTPHVAVLGDVFATPSWLPLHSVFSLGDAVIAIGFGVFLHKMCLRTTPPQQADAD